MTLALAFVLAGIIAAQTAVIVWLLYRTVHSADAAADARVAQSDTEAHLEQSQFEIEVVRKSLDAANARADALEKVLADDVNANPAPDLARADYMARVRRITAAWGATTRDPLPAVAADAVSEDSATATARTTPLPAGSATVR